MMIGKIISGIIGGLLVAILGAVVVGLASANASESDGQTGGVAFFIFWAIAFIIALTAQRAAKAWRRLLITSGLLVFAVPISSVIFSTNQVANVATQGGEYSGAETIGAFLGAGMVTAVAGLLSFFIGSILLISGFLIGRDKQVIVLKE
jgi:hypothetical protein